VPALQETKQIGDGWFDEKVSPALKVQSTVVQNEWNFVLNPMHPDFKELEIGEIRDFEFDERFYANFKKQSI
jgi:RES domain-containing protein